MDAQDTPAATLAAFLADLEFEALPDRAVRLAERCFADTVGVTLAGTDEPAVETARAAVDGSGETTLLGADATAPLAEAVLVNGTAGHALDFDDWGEVDCHQSVTLVAPALAVGEQVDATGQELLSAFVAGFETEWYLGYALKPGHYERGWHATATLGVFGAAAAAATLLDCSRDQLVHALNIAASFPAGLKRNFGSMTKPLHVGQAARSGVTAARLASEGFTADADAIGGQGGFWELYAGEGGVDEPTPLPPTRWGLLEGGVHVKKYPCCYFTHSSIAAAVALAEEHDLAPADIERANVRVSRGALDALAHDDPATGLEAKFSLPYTVAYGLVRGGPGLAAFEAGAWEDPTVDAVRERVSYAADPELPYSTHATRLHVETTDGTVHERRREAPPGTHADPLPVEALREKYEMCAGRILAPEAVESTWATLDSLRTLESCRELTARL